MTNTSDTPVIIVPSLLKIVPTNEVHRLMKLAWRFSYGALLSLVTILPRVAAPPNVVIFLADDAGWGDYSHSGNRQVTTPNIDSLAKEGVSLDRFFVCPVCSPTRAEFLTGRYHPRGGVRGVSTGYERLNLAEKTVAEAFQAAGYATGAFWQVAQRQPMALSSDGTRLR